MASLLYPFVFLVLVVSRALFVARSHEDVPSLALVHVVLSPSLCLYRGDLSPCGATTYSLLLSRHVSLSRPDYYLYDYGCYDLGFGFDYASLFVVLSSTTILPLHFFYLFKLKIKYEINKNYFLIIYLP